MEKRSIGIIGLGNMGRNVAKRLHSEGHGLVIYNRTREKYGQFRNMENIYLSDGLEDFMQALRKKGHEVVIWMMLPGGEVTNAMIAKLSGILEKGDVLIDASNAKYTDSVANYETLKKKSVFYLDVGCAGGPDDLAEGVSLMVGGDRVAYRKVEDIFRVIAGAGTYGYVGGSGAGQMTKLIHNGIFYGIFPIYVEGVELLMKANESAGGGLDLKEALRLLAASPPITRDIMDSILKVIEDGALPSAAPKAKVSDVIIWETEMAGRLGVSFDATRAVLGKYGSISEESRRLYAAAKKRITGH